MEWYAGLDEAGRGSLIGPLVICLAALPKERIQELKQLKPKDSKLLSSKQRKKLEAEIKQIKHFRFWLIRLSPSQIDSFLLKDNLNNLEALYMAKLISNALIELSTSRLNLTVDCPSVNIKRFRKKLLELIKIQLRSKLKHEERGKKTEEDIEKLMKTLHLVLKHKAESDLLVATASILAKVNRDSTINKLHAIYGNFGSGYPADPLTLAWLKKNKQKAAQAGIVRTSWSSWHALKQKKLFE